jgi:hypothetical protein
MTPLPSFQPPSNDLPTAEIGRWKGWKLRQPQQRSGEPFIAVSNDLPTLPTTLPTSPHTPHTHFGVEGVLDNPFNPLRGSGSSSSGTLQRLGVGQYNAYLGTGTVT